MGRAGHVTAFDFHSLAEVLVKAICPCMNACRAEPWRPLLAPVALQALLVSARSTCRSRHATPLRRTTPSVRDRGVVCSARLPRWSRQQTVAPDMEPVNEVWENQRFYGIIGWCVASASRLSQHSAGVAPANEAAALLVSDYPLPLARAS